MIGRREGRKTALEQRIGLPFTTFRHAWSEKGELAATGGRGSERAMCICSEGDCRVKVHIFKGRARRAAYCAAMPPRAVGGQRVCRALPRRDERSMPNDDEERADSPADGEPAWWCRSTLAPDGRRPTRRRGSALGVSAPFFSSGEPRECIGVASCDRAGSRRQSLRKQPSTSAASLARKSSSVLCSAWDWLQTCLLRLFV